MKKNFDYTTIFYDNDIVVLSKRSGLCIAADRYNPNIIRLDILAKKEFGNLFAVHRIDKDTSGIIVYARNENAHKNLNEQFQNRTVEKTYHCIIHGKPMWNTLTVDLPLLPDGDEKHRTVVNKRNGKPSTTDFKFLGNAAQYSWIEAKPKTGRTHQIRVHLAKNGFFIVCDNLYSGNQHGIYLSELKKSWRGKEEEEEERPLLSRLALHAYKISFNHPSTNERVTFTAPYMRDMQAVRNQTAKLFNVDPLKDEKEN